MVKAWKKAVQELDKVGRTMAKFADGKAGREFFLCFLPREKISFAGQLSKNLNKTGKTVAEQISCSTLVGHNSNFLDIILYQMSVLF